MRVVLERCRGGGILYLGFLLLAAPVQAQTSSAPVEVDVQDVRLYAGWAPGGPDSFSAALSGVPGVLVNSQGGNGVQSDLSIRGSSFSGAGLSVGGLALANPQTEHFNAELPLPSMLFAPPRVLAGLDEVLASSGHLVGSVDLEFRPMSEYGRLSEGTGEDQRNWQELFYNHVVNGADNATLGISAFGGREQADGVDYEDNNLDRWNGGAHLQFVGPARQLDAIVAHQEKEFGARGYYGVSPDWYADEKLDDTLMLATGRWGNPEEEYVRATALWRSSRDDYRLFMDPLYENEHESRTTTATAEGRQGVGGPVSVNWRVNGEAEALDSVRLGDHNRERGDLLLLPEWALGRARIYAGAKECVFSRESSDLLPQAGVRVAVSDTHSVFASYTESVRQPSYTELNYESPGSLGNSGLQRQEAQNVEAGWRWTPAPDRWCRVALFGTRSEHTVDWVKELATSPRWVATDLGTVDAGGFEFAGQYRVSDRFDVQSDYTWLAKHHDGDYYAGRYVLDYPTHLVHVTGEWRVTSAIRALFTQSFRWQASEGDRQEGDVGKEARLAVQCCPPKCDGLEITLACDNVGDDDTRVFPDLPVPGRRVSLSIAWAWK